MQYAPTHPCCMHASTTTTIIPVPHVIIVPLHLIIIITYMYGSQAFFHPTPFPLFLHKKHMQRNLHLTCVKEGRIRREGFYRTRFFFLSLLLISRSGGRRSSNVRQTLILMLFYYNNHQHAGIRFNEFSYSNQLGYY